MNTIFKRTKILATLGPVTSSEEKITELIDAGVNGFRFNFSHGSHEERLDQLKWIREASAASSRQIAVLQDLRRYSDRVQGVLRPRDKHHALHDAAQIFSNSTVDCSSLQQQIPCPSLLREREGNFSCHEYELRKHITIPPDNYSVMTTISNPALLSL